MKKIYKLAFVLPLVIAAGCEEDNTYNGPVLEKGDEVEFRFVGDGIETRTMYEDNWDYDATNHYAQKLFWGNYLETLGNDQVKVYCWNGARRVGTYEIAAADINPDNQSTAKQLTRLGETGVQWGDASATHDFYAFYPAKAADDEMLTATTIKANVQVGQSPVSWRATKGGEAVTERDILAWAQTNAAQNIADATTLYGNPDMSAAIMLAHTQVGANGYGQPVNLAFDVVADVLDFSVNGPVIPNSLGGNATGTAAGVQRSYIRINSVTVEHKDGKPISGDFVFDLTTKKASSISGDDRILLQFPGVTPPQLNVRVNKSEGVTSADVDHLRLRAFLIPGAVTNLNELQIRVSTDCGEYLQELNAQDMVSGQIHRVSLRYFNQRGQEFDFSRWMEQLDPTIYVTELSIPGTWHSTDGKYHNTTSLTSQYEAGIRAFETHANITQGSPQIEYSGTPTYKSKVVRADGKMQSDNTNNPTGADQTRAVYRTVTYTQTSQGKVNGKVKNAAFNVTNSASNDLLNGIMALGNEVREKQEFVFLEIGDPNSSTIEVPVVGTSVSAVETITKVITKRQTGTQKSRKNVFGGYSWGSTSWNNDGAEPTAAEWEDAPVDNKGISDVTYGETTKGNSYALGIDWLIKELQDRGSNIYTGGITPTTTINDVKGHYIIKINTNGDTNDNENGWTPDAPALFSRWSSNSEESLGSIALQWGAPIAPEAANPALHWVYSEKDNVTSAANRKSAVQQYMTTSVKIYNSGALGYWLELSVGGYLNGSASLANCQALARVMNRYMLEQLTSPTRQACPMGLLYFNTYTADEYKVTDLIRTIINNNSAFTLRRAGQSAANERTNSSFKLNPDNPLK